MSVNNVSYLGVTEIITVPMVVQAAAYASGDVVGGKLTLEGCNPHIDGSKPAGGLIQSVVITDAAKQSITKDVVFFDADPTNTTFAENGAVDIDDADLAKIIGVAQVSSWFAFNDNSVGQAVNLAIPFVIAGLPLYAAVVERGAPTYAAVTDLTLRVGILPA